MSASPWIAVQSQALWPPWLQSSSGATGPISACSPTTRPNAGTNNQGRS